MKENNEIMVSILCLAYNHENYIAEALESFVKQKSGFKFEVIINDDCSTDRTAEIIRQYEEKYPDIIKPVYQSENLYSQNIDIIRKVLIPRAKGKYVALCEGDDFFYDENKLQKQVEFLEQNQDYSLCIHNSILVDYKGKYIKNLVVSENNGEIATESVILGGGGFCATNSIMGPMRLFKNTPKYFDYFSLDYVWQVYLATSGRVYCFNEKLSAYRINVPGSWTSKLGSSGNEAKINIRERLINVRNLIDKQTDYKWHDAFELENIKDEYKIIKMKKNYKLLRQKKFGSLVNRCSLIDEIKILFRAYIIGNLFYK